MRIEAADLSQRVDGDRATLDGVSLTIESGRLVAIVGGSGAGKTTLLDALAGLRPPAAGSIRYDSTGSLRWSDVGYVPQDDIIHLELPLSRTLTYAARLRLPKGADAARAVREVLETLDLADRADVRVGSLSGGQRKRASIAVELLTKPQVFFLDEPTSGLDPATGAEVMRMLRRLADGGITVVVTTHTPADVRHCDALAVLTKNGRLAFYGAPPEALTHFGVASIDEIYEEVDKSPAPRVIAPHEEGPRAATRPPNQIRQWALLTRRNVDILLRNRLTLAILLGSPVMILLMFLVLFQPGAFGPAHPDPPTTVMTLFWIAFGGFFFGLTYGLLQICVEFPILRRERLAGLGVIPYVLAKATVLTPLLAVVDGLLIGVLRALDRLPAADAATYGRLFVTLLLSSAGALALGLLTSASVSDPSQAAIALPMLCFPQVLFVGAILPVPVMAVAGRAISYAMTNRWAFEGLGGSLGVTGLWGDSPIATGLKASYGDTFARAVPADWLILGGFTIAFLVATCLVLQQRVRGSRPSQAGTRSK
ncbi:ATP-binding cassette domain-containing protein [Streptosporangiaceae bacterium NEAU-GS5]|nr:ATP-binding cassette domain-containing protein [Streptosporangiaceae bacterium NEAU-GS5]